MRTRAGSARRRRLRRSPPNWTRRSSRPSPERIPRREGRGARDLGHGTRRPSTPESIRRARNVIPRTRRGWRGGFSLPHAHGDVVRRRARAGEGRAYGRSPEEQARRSRLPKAGVKIASGPRGGFPGPTSTRRESSTRGALECADRSDPARRRSRRVIFTPAAGVVERARGRPGSGAAIASRSPVLSRIDSGMRAGKSFGALPEPVLASA